MAGYETDATIVMNAVPGLTTGITTLMTGMASINNQFQIMTSGIQDGFGLVDAAIISTGALVAKLGWDAAQAYGQFEQGMRIVEVVSGETGSAIEQLSQKATEFSIQYRTDINQITDGLQTLGRAGLNSAQEQTEVLQNGLQTAKLEGRELNQVLTEILQNTSLLGGDIRSDQFGEQSTYVNDLLVSTSMTAPITSHDISQTLQYSGGLAATAGANINSEEGKDILTDYMATIAAFAQKGVKGSLAGTALRAFLNKPATQDSSVVEGLAMIKLKPEYLWEDDEETMKPISDQIALIQKQMDKLGVSQMDRLQIWSKILGGKMGQQMMKLNSEDIKELVTDIDSATSSQELANRSMNTFSQNLKQIEEQGQAVFRGIGEHIVKILNPILTIVDKVMGVLSNPVATFGIFAGGLALVIEAGRRLWGVIKAVKDEFMLMRAMATEALQAITAQSAAASGAVTTLGNLMIGGKAGGLTGETNKIAVLNEGLLKTKGLVADIQMQALGLSGGTKLLPGHYYNQALPSTLVGQETRSRQVLFGDETRTIHENRGFHVIDLSDEKQKYFANQLIDEEARNRYNAANERSPVKLPKEAINDFKKEVISEARKVGPGGNFMYLKGPWQQYDVGDELFNQQEKYAWAMANAKSGGSPVPLTTEEQKAAEEARAAAEQEVQRRKGLGFRGRLKEDLGKRLDAFEKQGRGVLRLDAIPGTIQSFQDSLSNTGASLRNFGSRIANIRLPFQGDGMEAFQQFRQKKGRYLNKADIEALTKGGYFTEKTGAQLLGMTGAERSKTATNILKGLGKRDDAIGYLYNEVYKTERTLGSALSSFRQRIGRVLNQPIGSGGSGVPINQRMSGFITRLRQGEVSLNSVRTRLLTIPGTLSSIGASVRGAGSSLSTRAFETATSIANLGRSAMQTASRIGAMSGPDISRALSGTGIAQRLRDFSSRLPAISAGAISGGVTRAMGGLAKGVSTTMGAFSTITHYMGGPVMLAMMAFSAIMSFITKKMQEYAEAVNEAKDDVKKAYSERNTAEDELKQAYSEQNPNATDEEIGAMVLDSYKTMRDDIKDKDKWLEKISETIEQPKYQYNQEKDDGSYKEAEDERTDDEKLQDSIDKNTSALYAASAKINIALDKLVIKMDDKYWGVNGIISQFSDYLGGVMDNQFGLGEGSSFTESGNVLLTSTQKDSNYPGYTEYPGLFLEDAFDSGGNLTGTLDRLFGADSDRYMGALHSDTKEFLKELTQSSRAMGRASNSRLQASMMNDKKSWQMGAKELAKYESKNKTRVGAQETKNTRLENLIKKLQIDTGLSRIQVLQGMYLQQMQDMYAVAEQVMVPLIGQTATSAANTMMLGQAEFPYNQGTTNYTAGTMQVAQVISSQLAVIAWAKAGEATRNAALMDPNNPLHELAMNTDDGNQFMKEAIKKEEGTDIGAVIRTPAAIAEPLLTSNTGLVGQFTGGKNIWELMTGTKSYSEWSEKTGITDPKKFKYFVGGGDTEAMNQILDTFGAETYNMLGMPMKDAIKEAKKDREALRQGGEDYSGIYDYYAKMWGSEQMAEKVFDAYMASGIGEDEGSGGGSGGGSGSDDKDKDTGTRKERVDLVLCNKKEIPKLNVNLFKKPPTFTVLNKNFKLRDVKINTEDKPKAIMASIKNAFIDVQKRSDPKIIQDEEAEYDPVGATDGNALPSGSSKPKTNNNS